MKFYDVVAVLLLLAMAFAFGFHAGEKSVPALQVTVKAPSAPEIAYSQIYPTMPLDVGDYVVIVGNCDQKGGK